LITIKEEFLQHEKLVRAVAIAGYEALGVWLAIKAYCSVKLTDGFIPKKDILALRLPKPLPPKTLEKAIDALVNCGDEGRDGSRGAGLLDVEPTGYQMHDYLDHSSAREEVELRREKARIKKQRQRDDARRQLELLRAAREGHQPPSPRLSPGDNPRDSAEDNPGDAPGVSPSGTRAPATRTRPSPAQPSPKDPSETTTQRPANLKHEPPKVVVAASDQRIPCPADLDLTPEQRASLEISPGIPGWAIDQMRAPWVAGELGDPSKTMTLAQWRKCLSPACCGQWNDATRRPKRQDGTESDDERKAREQMKRRLQATARALEAQTAQGGDGKPAVRDVDRVREGIGG
jgi:hypothetical protein